MFSIDGTYEVPLDLSREGEVSLNHQFLFWKERVEFLLEGRMIRLRKKGILLSSKKECPFDKAIIKMENDFTGGTGYTQMSKYAACIIVSGERMMMSRQTRSEYIEDYVRNLLTVIGKEANLIKIERAYS